MNLSRFVGERDALKIENAVLVYFDHWPWRFNAVETSTMKVAQLLDQKACSWPEHTCRATAMTPPACRIIPPTSDLSLSILTDSQRPILTVSYILLLQQQQLVLPHKYPSSVKGCREVKTYAWSPRQNTEPIQRVSACKLWLWSSNYCCHFLPWHV